jgi:hypothetical protein
LSIADVEKIVDERFHSKIGEKIDKMWIRNILSIIWYSLVFYNKKILRSRWMHC